MDDIIMPTKEEIGDQLSEWLGCLMWMHDRPIKVINERDDVLFELKIGAYSLSLSKWRKPAKGD